MRVTRSIAVLLSAACLPLTARAVEAHVTSSTQFLWYQDYLSSDKDQYDIAQLLRLDLSDIDGQGRVALRGYGRLDRSLSTSIEPRPGTLFNDEWTGRLYYLYLDFRDVVKDHLDLQAGRNYVSTAALPAVIDGLHLDARNLGAGFGATAFGGRRVIFDNKGEIGTAADTVWGASVYLDTLKYTHVEVSYARQYAGHTPAGGTTVLSYLAEEDLALDLSTTPLAMVNVQGRLRYDLRGDQVNEAFVIVNVTPIQPLRLTAEYYDSRPTFDQYSFYHFFNVNDFQQLSFGFEVQPLQPLRVRFKYAHELFGDDGSAESFEAGVTWRPLQALVLDASFERRYGFAGDVSGLRGSASYRLGPATLLAGADYDDFGRDDTGYGAALAGSTVSDGTAKKYWVGANWDITKMFSLVARAENNLTFYFGHAYQGYAALNINL